MTDEGETQPKRLGSMTTDQITAHINEHQRQMNEYVEQLVLRACLQRYTEQQQDELLTLVQEVVAYIEEVPIPLEWVDRRNEIITKLQDKL
jgi:hypothetical protein